MFKHQCKLPDTMPHSSPQAKGLLAIERTPTDPSLTTTHKLLRPFPSTIYIPSQTSTHPVDMNVGGHKHVTDKLRKRKALWDG